MSKSGAEDASIIAEVAAEAGKLSVEVADVAGHVDDVSARVKSQADLFKDLRDAAVALGTSTAAIGEVMNTIGKAMGEVAGEVSGITGAAGDIEQRCERLLGAFGDMSKSAAQSSDNLQAARERVNRLLLVGENLIGLTALSGVETVDTPFVRAAIEGAGAIQVLFEKAIEAGQLALSDLFDENYAPMNGTNPPQFTTRYVAFTDRVLPDVQEKMLTLSDKLVFCAAIDRNGFIATHNRKFSQAQGKDVAWNTANSRNRRFFKDRTGLAAGQSTKPFLVQTYRRDMGGGNFVLMKDVSAPIAVRDRHWGGLRIGYKI